MRDVEMHATSDELGPAEATVGELQRARIAVEQRAQQVAELTAAADKTCAVTRENVAGRARVLIRRQQRRGISDGRKREFPHVHFAAAWERGGGDALWSPDAGSHVPDGEARKKQA